MCMPMRGEVATGSICQVNDIYCRDTRQLIHIHVVVGDAIAAMNSGEIG